MDQYRQVKTSANFEEIPEDINANVSLVNNDTDIALCPGPLGSYACPACSDIEVYIAAFQRQVESIVQGFGDITISCVAVGAHDDQDEDCAEAEAEEHEEEVHNEGLYEVQVDEETLPRDWRDDEDPAEACDDTAHGSEGDQKDFAAIESRFRRFSNNFESTKEHVAEVNRRLKEFTKDIDDELESELDDQLGELQEFKNYLIYVFQEERFKTKCLETFLGKNGKAGEILKNLSAVWRPRVPKEYKESLTYILNQLSMLCSALSVRDATLAPHKTEIEVRRLYCMIKEFMRLVTLRLIMQKVAKELMRVKLSESLDIKEDDPESTSMCVRPCLGHDKENVVPTKLFAARGPNPSTAGVKRSYTETLRMGEAMDHKRIMATAFKDSVKWTELHQASESAWDSRMSPSRQDDKTPVKNKSKDRSTKSMWHNSRDKGMDCCGPGPSFLVKGCCADVLSVQVDFVSSITGTSEVMTIRPNIETESKDHEKIKFRESVDIQDDSLAVTREWLVMHAHSQEEISLSKMLMSRDISQERYNIYTNVLTKSLMSGIVSRRGEDRQ